ncbi:hypothetical protein Y032_0275g1066 [Ancylostoma ceylanicum]|uniref:Uncharacterized protein n=1 Tax=Ancylostoma ceylanicum TaxID=53326 RepID=A0A016S894_9BILA|nr:hypothetical protein Y032_0275g1066 [Ancylostoma ceylanicum]
MMMRKGALQGYIPARGEASPHVVNAEHSDFISDILEATTIQTPAVAETVTQPPAMAPRSSLATGFVAAAWQLLLLQTFGSW